MNSCTLQTIALLSFASVHRHSLLNMNWSILNTRTFICGSTEYKAQAFAISWLIISRNMFQKSCCTYNWQVENYKVVIGAHTSTYLGRTFFLPPRRILLSATAFKHAPQALNLFIAYVQVDHSDGFQVLTEISFCFLG